MSSENQPPWVLIVISIITLVGTLGAAVIGNWDKLAKTQDTQVVGSIEAEEADVPPLSSDSEITDSLAEAPSSEAPEQLPEQFMVNMPSDPTLVPEASANNTPTTSTLDSQVSHAPGAQSPQADAFPQTVRLTGKEPGSRVNLRPEPSTQRETGEYGLVGDTVTALGKDKGSDGHVWYYVQFPSQAKGWIREDFVEPIN